MQSNSLVHLSLCGLTCVAPTPAVGCASPSLPGGATLLRHRRHWVPAERCLGGGPAASLLRARLYTALSIRAPSSSCPRQRPGSRGPPEPAVSLSDSVTAVQYFHIYRTRTVQYGSRALFSRESYLAPPQQHVRSSTADSTSSTHQLAESREARRRGVARLPRLPSPEHRPLVLLLLGATRALRRPLPRTTTRREARGPGQRPTHQAGVTMPPPPPHRDDVLFDPRSSAARRSHRGMCLRAE